MTLDGGWCTMDIDLTNTRQNKGATMAKQVKKKQVKNEKPNEAELFFLLNEDILH